MIKTKMYHVTQAGNLPNILKNGLLPKLSKHERIFLCDSIQSAKEWRDILKEDSKNKDVKWVLLGVMVDLDKVEDGIHKIEFTIKEPILPKDIIEIKEFDTERNNPSYYHSVRNNPDKKKWILLKTAKDEDELLVAIDVLMKENIEYYVRQTDKKKWQIFARMGKDTDLTSQIYRTLKNVIEKYNDPSYWSVYGKYDDTPEGREELYAEILKLMNKNIECMTKTRNEKITLFVFKDKKKNPLLLIVNPKNKWDKELTYQEKVKFLRDNDLHVGYAKFSFDKLPHSIRDKLKEMNDE